MREGFRGFSQRSQGFIAAKSWLLKNAFVKDGDRLRIDPALVKVSSGDLRNPENIAVSLTETWDLKFTWNPAKDDTHPLDQIMMLAYDVEGALPVYKTTGQFRSTGEDILHLGGITEENFRCTPPSMQRIVAGDRTAYTWVNGNLVLK